MKKKYVGYHVTVARGYDDLHFKFSFDNMAFMVSLIELITNHNIENPNRSEGNKQKLNIIIELYEEEEDEV